MLLISSNISHQFLRTDFAPGSHASSCLPIPQSIVLINTSLDLCNRFFVSSSALLSPIFHSNFYITDKSLCKISFQPLNPCLRAHLILITSWVTSKLETLFSRPNFNLYLSTHIHLYTMFWPLTTPFHFSGIHQ